MSKRRKKKSGDKKRVLTTIVLITAILDLIDVLLNIVEHLIE